MIFNLEHVWFTLRRAFTCRLCLRIAVAVFLAILVAEAGVLFFSIKSYEKDRLAEVEREAIVVMRTILRSANAAGTLDTGFSETARLLRDGSVLVGAQVFDKAGVRRASFGETPVILESLFGRAVRRRLSDGTRMDVAWPPFRIQMPYSVTARIDTGEISGQINGFIWRIAGLVLLISVFVTIVTMIVLDRMVLAPIIDLDHRLTGTGEDPNNPEKYIMDSTRSDELGDVIRAFNGMLRWSGSNLATIKKNERDLLIAKNQAEQDNLAKSAFLSSMSHELRTPMNAVLGFGQLLQFNPKEPLSAAQSQYVDNILEGGQHLLDLINEILDLAKIEAGMIDLTLENVNVEAVLVECLSLMTPLARKRGIQITVGDSFKSNHSVYADEIRIKQCLLNLMSNGIKYNKENGTLTLDCKITPEGMLRVVVTDTGVGIAEDILDDLFVPFNRLQADVRDVEGTGIGLTITRQLIESMGGMIGVETRLGDGTTFWFDLPMQER
ncbi:MAG TPA: hypothetical protein ENI69_00575 [Rhodospirillales bacterium]|nr:hypothetical protein [Rhodospirillales bacterium]